VAPPQSNKQEGKGGRYDKSADLNIIAELVLFMATPAALHYIGLLCDAPFRSTLHR
jgi:hypothetical protein